MEYRETCREAAEAATTESTLNVPQGTIIERTFDVPQGTIHYWVNWKNMPDPTRTTLVFLPGLTADHRLFDAQIAHFAQSCNVFVWDAPGHFMSRPFTLDFALKDKAHWLADILEREGVQNPVLVGQSMGGYVSQMFIHLFPGRAAGFVSIDSCPLKRSYYRNWELSALKHCEGMYLCIPWKLLLSWGSWGVATSAYGRSLMRIMMESYEKRPYCKLTGHGFRILAEAVEANLPYEISCPFMAICGEKDMAGSAKNYNRRWQEQEDIDLHWIADAGHNANADKPDEINALIEGFIARL